MKKTFQEAKLELLHLSKESIMTTSNASTESHGNVFDNNEHSPNI